MNKKWRLWFLDILRFRYGITVECSEDKIKDLIYHLEKVGCTVENCNEYKEIDY